jgi:hypothetical protein
MMIEAGENVGFIHARVSISLVSIEVPLGPASAGYQI